MFVVRKCCTMNTTRTYKNIAGVISLLYGTDTFSQMLPLFFNLKIFINNGKAASVFTI